MDFGQKDETGIVKFEGASNLALEWRGVIYYKANLLLPSLCTFKCKEGKDLIVGEVVKYVSSLIDFRNYLYMNFEWETGS